MTEKQRRRAKKRIAGRCAGDRHEEPAAVQLDPVGPRQGRSDATAGRAARRQSARQSRPQPGASLRGEDAFGLRVPRAGDGERAVPDAWRAQHRASDTGGESEPDRRAHHAWAPRGTAAEGSAGDPDAGQSDAVVCRGDPAGAVRAGGGDGGVGAVSARVPAAQEAVGGGGFAECATNPLHLSAAAAPCASRVHWRGDWRGAGFGGERPSRRAGGGAGRGGVAGTVAAGRRICSGGEAGGVGREAGCAGGQAGGLGGEAGGGGGTVDRAGTREKW